MQRAVAEVHSGEVATYIPELAMADPRVCALSLATLDGGATAGEAVPFTIQSVSTPFLYALALADSGAKAVLERVGAESTGDLFSSISLDDLTGRAYDPMVDAGAIVTAAMVGGETARGAAPAHHRRGCRCSRADRSRSTSTCTGPKRATGDRNRAIAWLMRSAGRLDEDVEAQIAMYFTQCSIVVTASDLAGDLSFAGVEPLARAVLADADAWWRELDLRRVTRIDRAGVTLLGELSDQLSGAGTAVVVVGPVARLPRAADRGLAPGQPGSPDADEALEWCETRLLAAHGVDDPLADGLVPLAVQHLLAGLPEDVVGSIEERTTTRAFTAGTVDPDAGDDPDGLCSVGAGQVTVDVRLARRGGRRRLGTVAAGAVLGELTLVEGRPRSTRSTRRSATYCHHATSLSCRTPRLWSSPSFPSPSRGAARSGCVVPQPIPWRSTNPDKGGARGVRSAYPGRFIGLSFASSPRGSTSQGNVMAALRRIGAGVAAAAVGLVLVVAPGGTAGADAPSPGTVGPSYIRGGNLFLWTGSGAAVTYDRNRDGLVNTPTSSTPGTDAVQSVSGSRSTCLITTDKTLLGFDGQLGFDTVTNLASFAGGSIGVAEKKTGTSCAQVAYSSTASSAEKLTLDVSGTNLVGDLGAPVAGSAYLDVELKASARILATVFLKGNPVGAYELQSGSTIGATPTSVAVTTPTGVKTIEATRFTCTNASDSGPDSGVGDNCRWPISSPSWLGANDGIYFDKLELKPLNGYFSLEGGADGTVATTAENQLPTPGQIAFPAGQGNADVVELYDVGDGQLGCNQFTPVVPGSTTDLSPDVSVRRLANADQTENGGLCVAVPYSLRNGAQQARFLKSLTTQRSAQFVFSLKWTVPFTTTVPTSTVLPETTANYETAYSSPNIPLGWCPDPVYDTSTGLLSGIAGVLTNSAIPDQDNVLTGKQFSCVVSRNTKIVNAATDYVEVTEQVYVLGDILLQKGR